MTTKGSDRARLYHLPAEIIVTLDSMHLMQDRPRRDIVADSIAVMAIICNNVPEEIIEQIIEGKSLDPLVKVLADGSI